VSTNYIPSIDYTSRDYSSILLDMTSLIKNFSPTWTSRDPADFGMTLVELFAYMGDILNYYIDRAANEGFLSTATQRRSVLQLANLLGYTPTDAVAATTTLTFTNSTGSDISLPALTQVATSLIVNSTTAQVIFETDSALTVPANSTATVSATQGITINELVEIASSAANQTYVLKNTSVINNTVQVTVGGVSYNRVQYLIDAGSYDPVFTTFTNSEGITYITFGDGVSGRIPPSGVQIYATYRTGDGAMGNVAANLVKNIIKTPGQTTPIGLTVYNSSAATGGADAESIDSIRLNAALSIRAVNRAVSLTDYSYLAVQVTGVAKAIATADTYSSVTLYLAPVGDPGVEADNVTSRTTFNNLLPSVLSYLTDKIPANTTVTFQPPTYVGAYLTVNITVLPQYKQSSVLTNATAALNSLFDIDNVVFHDTIAVSDVIDALSTVEGIAFKNISKMVRADQDQTYVITNKALTSNVATLTTSVNHTLKVGQTITVTNIDTTFNGTFVVTAVTSNTFSYSLIAGNVSSTSSGGGVTALTVNDIVCGVNEIPTIRELITVGAVSGSGVGNITVNITGGIS
jgi:Baseplate J-like protein